MGALGGLFQGEWQDDFGAIASRAAEQLANTRAASQSEQQKTSVDIVKRPPPTRSVSIVENPDGTITHTTTVKNAPKQPPAKEVAAAANEPYAQFTQHVLSTGAQLGQQQIGDVDKTLQTIDQTLSTRAGRVSIAKELGIDDPADTPGEFLRSGLLNYRAKRKAYEDVVNDPGKLRRAIIAKQFTDAQKTAESLRPFNEDERKAQTDARLAATEDRQVSAEERRQHSAEMSQLNTAIHNIRSVDMTARTKTPDEAVDAWRAVYGDDYAKKLEPIIRSEWDARKATRDLADAKEKRAEAKTQQERDAWDLRIKHLELSNENLQSVIATRDKKASTQTLSRQDAIDAPVDELLGHVGDDSYDQKSVEHAITTKRYALEKEQREIKAKLPIKQARAAAIKKDEPWKKEEFASLTAESDQLTARLQEVTRDLGLITSRPKAPTGPAPQPAPNTVQKFHYNPKKPGVLTPR